MLDVDMHADFIIADSIPKALFFTFKSIVFSSFETTKTRVLIIVHVSFFPYCTADWWSMYIYNVEL